MSAIVLALTAAAGWGAADFVGGVAGRRASAVPVAFASQLVGLIGLLVLAPFVPAPLRLSDLAWGVGAGAGAAVGVALLYHGLAVGLMSVVAPVTAVGAACIPVLVGLLSGDRPPGTALAGVVVALAAVALLCAFPANDQQAPFDEDGASALAGPDDGPDRSERARAGLLTGLVSGAGFGAYFVFLGHAGHDAGLWPLLGSRTTAVALLAGALALTRQRLLPAGFGWAVVAVGGLDVVANVSYLLATRRGLLSIVALLASLYPAATVVMARVLLRERLSRTQAVGLAGAGGAILLIALG